MNHYYNKIENGPGAGLVGYFARVINRTTQNTVALSSDENGTPIVTVSGVENMAKTDSLGNISFYVEPGTYHLDIYAPNTTSFLYRVSDVAMNSTKGDPGPQGEQGLAGEGLEEVMAPGGASLVGYTPPTVPATIARPTAARLADSIRAHDHGAYGDGSPNPVSQRFATLTAARAAMPGVTINALTDRFDGLALQAAINRAKTYYLPGSGGGYLTRAKVRLREGRYTVSNTVQLPNSVEIEGAGSGATIIDGQTYTVAGPMLTNAETGSVDMRLSGLSVHGGTHNVKIDSGSGGQVNSLRFHDVHMRLASDKAFEVNRLLQLADFENCVFGQSVYGLHAPAWTTNAVNLRNCSFEELSWNNITLRSAESVNIYGGRFEAGGNNGRAAFTGSISGTTLTVSSVFAGTIRAFGALIEDGAGAAIVPGTSIDQQLTGTTGGVGTYKVNISQTVASRAMFDVAATIDLARATPADLGCQVTLQGVYIENTHQLLIRDQNSRNGVTIADGCHFTQALDNLGNPAPYYMYSDGIIAIGSIDISEQPVLLPTNALITGQASNKLRGNSNVYSSRRLGGAAFRSRRVAQVGSGAIPAVRFVRPSARATGVDFTQSNFVLRVNVNGYDGTTGAVIKGSITFRGSVDAGTGVLGLTSTADTFTGSAAAATFAIDLASGATSTDATLRIVPTNLNGSTATNIWWSLTEEGSATLPEEVLTVTCL